MKQFEISSVGGAANQSKTGKRRLAVNAAFLKDIKDDSQDLKMLLDQITPITRHQQTAVNHWPELIILMSDLRDQLALHFSFSTLVLCPLRGWFMQLTYLALAAVPE